MKSDNWDQSVLLAHRAYIQEETARVAFHTLVAAAIASPAYETAPGWHGEIRDFKYDDPASDERPFAFIVNRGHLLFYVRKAGLARVPGGFEGLKRQFSTAHENKAGEWTVRVASSADAARLNEFLFAQAPARALGAKSFTQYWKNSEPHWHKDDYEALGHAASNQFRAREVKEGCIVYIVTLIDGNVHLGGALRVDKVLTLSAARKEFGNDVWEAKDHIVMRNPGPFYKDLTVPVSVLQELRFDGEKALVFKSPGTLDTQTLRGIRELTPASARLLANLLESARQQERETAAMFPDQIESDLKYIEGASRQVLVNAYERDPKARKTCLEHHGFDCTVCGFNFEVRYGAIGREFIHVHHLKPIAIRGGEYQLDPIEDLRPVCPNCHAMLHRGERVMSIEDLRGILTGA